MADVCPTEDAIEALLEYLVDPLLPVKYSLRETPSQSQQQSIAKQVYAVVLLYNYYVRKQHPELELLGFESFCKLAVVLRPALLVHLTFMKGSNDTELEDLAKKYSIAEKMIMDACNISKSLDASREVPYIEGWPISKVAVLLVDSKKENCFLLFSSTTQGVWSVFQKDVDVSNQSSEGTMEAEYADEKRRAMIRKPLRVESKSDEAGFLQLAYLAVQEATGISQTDLRVLENHLVYSVSKDKTATRFYIMTCTQSVNNDVNQVPIKDAIDSLQGPLLRKSSGRWTVTPVVEYFHILPYVGIFSEWICSPKPNRAPVPPSPENCNLVGSDDEETHSQVPSPRYPLRHQPPRKAKWAAGEESCSSSAELPTSEWPFDELASSVSEKEVVALRDAYQIPSVVTMRRPESGEVPSSPPKGEIALSTRFFEYGLRLPLQPFVRRFLHCIELSPIQLYPNVWRALFSSYILWQEHFSADPSPLELQALFQIRLVSEKSGLYYYYSHTGRPYLSNTKDRQPWQESWFFVGGDWESELPDPNPQWHVSPAFGTVEWSSSIPSLPKEQEGRIATILKLPSQERDVKLILTDDRLANAMSSSKPPRSNYIMNLMQTKKRQQSSDTGGEADPTKLPKMKAEYTPRSVMEASTKLSPEDFGASPNPSTKQAAKGKQVALSCRSQSNEPAGENVPKGKGPITPKDEINMIRSGRLPSRLVEMACWLPDAITERLETMSTTLSPKLHADQALLDSLRASYNILKLNERFSDILISAEKDAEDAKIAAEEARKSVCTLEKENDCLKDQVVKLKGENNGLRNQVTKLEGELQQKDQEFESVHKDSEREIESLKTMLGQYQKHIENVVAAHQAELVDQFHFGFYACKEVAESVYPDKTWDFLKDPNPSVPKIQDAACNDTPLVEDPIHDEAPHAEVMRVHVS